MISYGVCVQRSMWHSARSVRGFVEPEDPHEALHQPVEISKESGSVSTDSLAYALVNLLPARLLTVATTLHLCLLVLRLGYAQVIAGTIDAVLVKVERV